MSCGLFSSEEEENEYTSSPLQLRLIRFLHLDSFFLDRFVFRRCQPKYRIRKDNGVTNIYVPTKYTPPQGYSLLVEIIQLGQHSVPVLVLSPIHPPPNMHTIIYSHGNASDLYDSLLFVERLATLHTSEYIIYDYTGYGESRLKTVGQEIICGDLEMVIAWCRRPHNTIILWGFSLGTYPVIRNAAKHNVKASILLCPIASISSLFHTDVHYQMKFKDDHFASLEHIGLIRRNMLIIHSTGDEVIPFTQAKALYDMYCSQNNQSVIRLVEIGKLGHNQLHKYIIARENNQLQNQVLDFIQNSTSSHELMHNTHENVLLQMRKNIKEVSLEINLQIGQLPSLNEGTIYQMSNKKVPQNCFCFP